VPVEIEFVGGPMDGRRVTLPCTPEELPPALKATDRGAPVERVALAPGTTRYERDTAAIGTTWHYRYEDKR